MSFVGDHSQSALPEEMEMEAESHYGTGDVHESYIREDPSFVADAPPIAESDAYEDDTDSDAVVGYGKPAEAEEEGGIVNLNEIPSFLRLANFSAFVIQGAQAGVLGWLASIADTNWPLYTNFPDYDGGDFAQTNPVQFAAFSITWYSCVFLGLSSVDHLLVCFPWIVRKYEHCIRRHQNPFRWAEYTLSASLMRVMIAQLSGITDIFILGGIFFLAATTMLLGACHESINAVARADGYRQNWFPFFVAWVPHCASWAAIFYYFFVAVGKADPPAFVWAIVWVLFALDGTFALLFYLQWAKIGMFADYVKGEYGFIILSLTAKAALAWINYGAGAR